MWGNGGSERANELFQARFTPDGSGYLYRGDLKSAPVRVTAEERDRFVHRFERQQRFSFWSLLAGCLLIIPIVALALPSDRGPLSRLAVWGGIGIVGAIFVMRFRWTWNAPTRELAARPPVGRARTREEARAVHFSRITYAQLAMAVLAAAIVLVKESRDFDVLHGWGRLWLVLCAGLAGGAVVQAYRKWRFEAENGSLR